MKRKQAGRQGDGGTADATAATREFGAFKGRPVPGTGPLEIADLAQLLKLGCGGTFRHVGDVVIKSDVWEKFPYDITIDGNLRCPMLKVGGFLKVNGSINAAILDIDGDLHAGSVRCGRIDSRGKVHVEGSVFSASDINATELTAKTATAQNITAELVGIRQHLQSTTLKAKALKAGSAKITMLNAFFVAVEYDLRCQALEAESLAAGTLEPDGNKLLASINGSTTLTGKTGRPWTDSGD